MDFAEYRQHDATALSELVHRGEVSAQELLATARAAIAQLNPRLNAVVHHFDALSQRQLEALPAEAPFRGVPFLLKDMLDFADTPMSVGSRLLKNHVCHRSHEILRRLEASGLLFLGRTNMSELGLVPTTEPRFYGPTLNPWDISRSSGGSSGGAAAAVASGMVPMAYGGDGGGSVRIPAHACGLFGLKPSRGRNPNEPWDEPDGFVVHHVLSRTVRDSAAVLDITAGSRPFDRWQLAGPETSFRDQIERDPRPLRIAFTTSDFAGREAAPECVAAVQQTASLLESLGHEVTVARPAVDWPAYSDAFKVIWSTATGYFVTEVQRILTQETAVPAVVRRALKSRRLLELALSKDTPFGPSALEPATVILAKIERNLTPADLWRAWQALRMADVQLRSFYENYDVLLMPVVNSRARPIGELDLGAPADEIEAYLLEYVAYTPVANTSGCPAMSVPMHWDDRGMPVGAQFMAPVGDDGLLLQLAAQLERAQPWFDRVPSL